MDSVKPKKKIELEGDEELLRWLRSTFTRDYRAKKGWFTRKRDYSRFYDGDQWTEEEKRILEARNQPPVVINRIKDKMDSIFGLQHGLKVNTKARDRGTLDFETAKYVTEALRYVEQQNDFDQLESEVFEDQTIDGLGWFKVGLRWDGLEAEIALEKLDNEDVVEDCDSVKADLADATRVHESKWVSTDVAGELFPGNEEEWDRLLNMEGNSGLPDEEHLTKRGDQYRGSAESDEFSNYVNRKDRLVRLTTTQYRTPYRQAFYTAPNLGTVEITSMSKKDLRKMKESFPQGREWNDVGYRLHQCTFVWSKVLERKVDIKPWDSSAKFDYVKAPGYVTRDKKKEPYGLVKQMMDPQREVNKRRAKFIHILSTNQIEMEEGAVDDVEATRSEAAKPDGVIVRKKDFFFQRLTDINVGQQHFLLLGEAKGEIDAVGVKGELQGQSQATSGRDYQLRQQQATQSLRKMFANLRGARRRVFLLVLDYMQQYWTNEKVIAITDDPNAATLVLNKKVVDPATGEERILNDLSLGKYDVIIEEAPDTPNLASETFEGLIQFAQATKAQIPFDILLEASPLPNKKQLLERYNQAQAQQAQMMQAAQAQGMPAA